METILPCHPKDLPKLADGTVLTLPITISIAVPVEKVKFWQSAIALWLSIIIIIFTCLTVWFVNYLAMPVFLRFFSFAIYLIPFGGFFIQIWKASIQNDSNQILLPNFLLESKIGWKTQEIMSIDSDKILLTDFFGESKQLNLDEIHKFIVEEFSRYRPYTGFSVEYIVPRRNHFNTIPYRVNYQYLLLNSHKIRLRELLNLMNTTKKTNSNEITSLSMDNYENLMDIGI